MKYGLIRTFSPPAHKHTHLIVGLPGNCVCLPVTPNACQKQIMKFGTGEVVDGEGIVDCSLQALFAFILAGLKGMTVV